MCVCTSVTLWLAQNCTRAIEIQQLCPQLWLPQLVLQCAYTGPNGSQVLLFEQLKIIESTIQIGYPRARRSHSYSSKLLPHQKVILESFKQRCLTHSTRTREQEISEPTEQEISDSIERAVFCALINLSTPEMHTLNEHYTDQSTSRTYSRKLLKLQNPDAQHSVDTN